MTKNEKIDRVIVQIQDEKLFVGTSDSLVRLSVFANDEADNQGDCPYKITAILVCR